jgi:hypothetical protein
VGSVEKSERGYHGVVEITEIADLGRHLIRDWMLALVERWGEPDQMYLEDLYEEFHHFIVGQAERERLVEYQQILRRPRE